MKLFLLLALTLVSQVSFALTLSDFNTFLGLSNDTKCGSLIDEVGTVDKVSDDGDYYTLFFRESFIKCKKSNNRLKSIRINSFNASLLQKRWEHPTFEVLNYSLFNWRISFDDPSFSHNSSSYDYENEKILLNVKLDKSGKTTKSVEIEWKNTSNTYDLFEVKTNELSNFLNNRKTIKIYTPKMGPVSQLEKYVSFSESFTVHPNKSKCTAEITADFIGGIWGKVIFQLNFKNGVNWEKPKTEMFEFKYAPGGFKAFIYFHNGNKASDESWARLFFNSRDESLEFRKIMLWFHNACYE